LRRKQILKTLKKNKKMDYPILQKNYFEITNIRQSYGERCNENLSKEKESCICKWSLKEILKVFRLFQQLWSPNFF